MTERNMRSTYDRESKSRGSLSFSYFAMVFIASTDQVFDRPELYSINSTQGPFQGRIETIIAAVTSRSISQYSSRVVFVYILGPAIGARAP